MGSALPIITSKKSHGEGPSEPADVNRTNMPDGERRTG
jgi:hypothetical protein